MGLKGEYQLEIKDKLHGCAKPDVKKLIFDKKYYDSLSEPEFRAAVVHELGHVKSKQCLRASIKILIAWALPLALFGIIMRMEPQKQLGIILGWLFYLYVLMRAMHRNHEFEADKIACEYQDNYVIEALISAIDKADCRYSFTLKEYLFSQIKKTFPHPTNEERYERIRGYKKV